MNDQVKQAVDMFNEGYSCSQAVVAAFGDRFGLDRDTALKISSGLGGGIGRTGDVCGAVTGAILILGLKYGSTNPRDKTGKFAAYKKVQEFCEAFKDRAGSMICRELLGFDFRTQEGSVMAAQPGAFKHCPGYVEIAAEVLETMLKQ
jgi:C_GCAxxG_C_C family probable redox protein